MTGGRGRKKIVRIDALLGEMLDNRNWRENLARNRVFEFWDEAVGKDIAAHARPKVIHGKVLWVDVTDSIWMQQLHFQKEHLREVVNKRIPGEDRIDDIRFKLVTTLIPSLPVEPLREESRPRREPDPQRMAEFEKLLVAIGDEGVRNSLRTIWLAQQDRK